MALRGAYVFRTDFLILVAHIRDNFQTHLKARRLKVPETPTEGRIPIQIYTEADLPEQHPYKSIHR
jgi:hypothetical protein